MFPLAETLQLYSSGRGLFLACGKPSTEGTPQGFMERRWGGLGVSSTYVNSRPQTPLCFSPHPIKAGPSDFVPQTSAELCPVPGVGIGRASPISWVCLNGVGEGGTSEQHLAIEHVSMPSPVLNCIILLHHYSFTRYTLLLFPLYL